jgi:hypothetical protein
MWCVDILFSRELWYSEPPSRGWQILLCKWMLPLSCIGHSVLGQGHKTPLFHIKCQSRGPKWIKAEIVYFGWSPGGSWLRTYAASLMESFPKGAGNLRLIHSMAWQSFPRLFTMAVISLLAAQGEYGLAGQRCGALPWCGSVWTIPGPEALVHFAQLCTS